MPPALRRAVVSRTAAGCAPLFVCARRGNAELAEYLVHVCDAPLEQRGVYDAPDERAAHQVTPLWSAILYSYAELAECLVHVCDAPLEQRGVYDAPDERAAHQVTPLWCAAVAGRLGVLRVLADAGADLDAGSDSGSTPVRSACFMTHEVRGGGAAAGDAGSDSGSTPVRSACFMTHELCRQCGLECGRSAAVVDEGSYSGSTPVRSACFMTHESIVRELVERGANIHKPNHNGGTCLINSVQSTRLCAYLLSKGAQVDACDLQLKTALHYAAQEHRADTARLLLAHGADPARRSRAGDDALRTAALKGAASIVTLLTSRGRYSVDALADAYELLGATQLDELNEIGSALANWRHATALRHTESGYIPKRGHQVLGGGDVTAGATEWTTHEQLDALSADVEALRVQALLVAARILGPHHKDTVFRLMYR
ncbi:unnamed protein product [Plutella xylostella]|uniref:(diamondback moth) hypothetical protein n=1 Tax=Plutella xylostella TaxID=51655 RepID=A0A8S4G4W5_PLUXY|nr:unnamed protein product [Plutella xylostella]